MAALTILFVIIVLSISVIRVGAIALELTGLNPEVAAFQAQSAFSGAGFTTSESESIVSHPVRRKITRVLILLGSAGFSSSIASLILAFMGQTGKNALIRLTFLGLGLLFLFLLARSKALYRLMKKVIAKALENYSKIKIYDYQEILGLQRGYLISRFKVKSDNWMVDRFLRDLKLHLEGLIVLSIDRTVEGKKKFIGVPTADTVIKEGDELICYGREEASKSLCNRPKGFEGDEQHEQEREKENKSAQERNIKGGYS